MKLKAVLNNDCDPEVKSYLEGNIFRDSILREVLVPHLHVPINFGPAEFYIQHCDLANSAPMCETRLTGVSVTKNRSTNDFHRALEALEASYKVNLEELLPHGQSCQLMVSMMLDQIPFGETSNLLERPPIMVHSKN
jgi:hypothetical protein